MVRIHLPPAESHVRTCLSREFVSPGQEAAVFGGCAGRGERRGRQRRAGGGNIRPTGGNISVGPYSSTAPQLRDPGVWCRERGAGGNGSTGWDRTITGSELGRRS